MKISVIAASLTLLGLVSPGFADVPYPSNEILAMNVRMISLQNQLKQVAGSPWQMHTACFHLGRATTEVENLMARSWTLSSYLSGILMSGEVLPEWLEPMAETLMKVKAIPEEMKEASMSCLPRPDGSRAHRLDLRALYRLRREVNRFEGEWAPYVKRAFKELPTAD